MSQSISAAGAATSQDLPEPGLNKSLHLRYWLRCLKTFLPTAYTEQDGSRIPLAFFVLSALDLLSGLESHTTPQERTSFADYIYSCQHPAGGFRAFPGTKFGDERRNEENERWDPANIAGTYFALASLVVLGDDLSRVRRWETLEWVKRLQHSDGSFGEVSSGGGPVDGGQDTRFCFLAALVCLLLGSGTSRQAIEATVDANALARFIFASQRYDGGIARKPHCESHAGSSYCGLSTLILLERLHFVERKSKLVEARHSVSGEFQQSMLHWLVSRQTCMLADYRDLDNLDEDDADLEEAEKRQDGEQDGESGFAILGSTPALPPHMLDFESLECHATKAAVAGMNGRCNKPADTCYSFWVGASLAILGKISLANISASRQYLLSKTQHRIGGFSKFPGDPPDILHSYFALASLSLMGEPSLKHLDPILCMTLDAKSRLNEMPWRKEQLEDVFETMPILLGNRPDSYSSASHGQEDIARNNLEQVQAKRK